MARLTIQDHARESAGMTYVYPVVSRRAGGVSVGINLNPNNACNWRCIYCQVPNLVRGKAPTLDLGRLESELDRMLRDIVEGDFMERNVDADHRRLNDIALSGNGESTTAREFPEVVDLIGRAVDRFELSGAIKVVLITNGSMVHVERVREALVHMADMNGEVWFKMDRATKKGLATINSVAMEPSDHLSRLRMIAPLIPTYIQTCMFQIDGAPPPDHEVEAYLGALRDLVRDEVPVRGVLLYGLARESHQPEAEHLSAVDEGWLSALGDRIRQAGLSAKVTP